MNRSGEKHARGHPDHTGDHDHAAAVAQAHAGHDTHVEHAGHDQGHMVADYKKRFWTRLVLTVPVLALSPMVQDMLGLGERSRFARTRHNAS